MTFKQLLGRPQYQKAAFPYYTGIQYTPTDYTWSSNGASADVIWDWQASEASLDELQQDDGSIDELPPQLNADQQQIIADFIEEHHDNRFVIEHFQKPLLGLMITVPDNVVVKQPLSLTLRLNSDQPVALTFILKQGRHSQININQQVVINGAAKNVSVVVIGQQKPTSQLSLTTSLRSKMKVATTLWGVVNAAADCRTKWSLAPLTRGQLLGAVAINLKGAGSRADLKTISIGTADQHVGFQGSVNHYAPHTTSRINMRGVLFNQSQVNLTSVGNIVHGAFDADAQQESRLMTVGTAATGTVNPLLIIDESDVQAGHASSVGQYDEDELYYLLSRGLTRTTAQKVLVDNFIAPVFQHLNPTTQTVIRQSIKNGIEEEFDD